jgi:hypothetical protein
MTLLAALASIAARDPQPPRARALDRTSSQAPKAAGQRRRVNTMSTGKRPHDG